MLLIATTKRLKSPPKTHSAVVKLIKYILNPEKTEDEKCLYTDSINCSIVCAADEFKTVRERFQKTSGNYAYHFEQSFKPGEVTPEECHQCGQELADALFGSQGYQVVFATHLDRAHLHNHFVVNAVNSITGMKLQTDHAFIRQMRTENDRICQAHNLSVIENPQGKGKSYAEWITEKQGGFTWRGMIRQDIDEAIPASRSIKEMLEQLEVMGYQVKQGKHIGVRPPGSKTFFRLYKLGEGYSEQELAKRIIFNNDCRYPANGKNEVTVIKRFRVVRVRYKGSFPIKHRKGGFRGLYLHYLFRLRKILHSQPNRKKRMPVQARKDSKSVREFVEDLHLLNEYKIDTFTQLSDFYAECKKNLAAHQERRKVVSEKIIVCSSDVDFNEIEQELNQLDKQIKTIKSQMRSAERIYDRSDKIRTTINQINQTEKGMMNNVSRSRSNRYFSESINGRN